MLLAGADGCREGWVVVRAEDEAPFALRSVKVVASFKALLVATQRCAAVAVDIPIGLVDGAREADVLARRVLSPMRSSSVFPAPYAAVVERFEESWYEREGRRPAYVEVCALTAALRGSGKGMSWQAFFIIRKIREAQDAMTPALQQKVVEAHPEVAFTMLNGGRPLASNKKTRDGRSERELLLNVLYGEDLALRLAPKGAGRDDLYDAAVLVWTASRLAHGAAQRLPPEPPLDARGLRMEIVY